MTVTDPSLPAFEAGAEFARRLDLEDPLSRFRSRFHLPQGGDGEPLLYFLGNSLGLQPVGTAEVVNQELSEWAGKGAAGHFEASTPWYDYHRALTHPLARIAGANPGEVVAMNSLTVNLHLLMISFFRPAGARHKILMEKTAFPSDQYAVQTQLRFHGLDPNTALLFACPPAGEEILRTEDLLALLADRGKEIALVLLGGVNYFTGQVFDIARIASEARRQGCTVGVDLAHAIGNIPLALHDWDVDFAVWCSYKYLNAGPGAVGGCFVHERHARGASLPRLAGWWGNDPETRFKMPSEFVPNVGAEGWQVSNPSILSMAPLRASLPLFEEAGMENLRSRSLRLTGYLDYLLRRIPGNHFHVLTPADPAQRGCQLSLRTRLAPGPLLRQLQARGIVADVREPDVVRVAPVPLYNRFEEVWRFAQALGDIASSA